MSPIITFCCRSRINRSFGGGGVPKKYQVLQKVQRWKFSTFANNCWLLQVALNQFKSNLDRGANNIFIQMSWSWSWLSSWSSLRCNVHLPTNVCNLQCRLLASLPLCNKVSPLSVCKINFVFYIDHIISFNSQIKFCRKLFQLFFQIQPPHWRIIEQATTELGQIAN